MRVPVLIKADKVQSLASGWVFVGVNNEKYRYKTAASGFSILWSDCYLCIFALFNSNLFTNTEIGSFKILIHTNLSIALLLYIF